MIAWDEGSDKEDIKFVYGVKFGRTSDQMSLDKYSLFSFSTAEAL